jgi:hypothetical protein
MIEGAARDAQLEDECFGHSIVERSPLKQVTS